MEVQIENFLNRATVNDLKAKLSALKLQTTGPKATLKLRLDEAWRSLPVDQLMEHVPTHFEGENAEILGGSSHIDEEEDDLDQEIENLRRKVDKRKEIAELKRKLQELTDLETVSNPRSFVHFKDVEESLAGFSGDDNYPVEKWVKNFEESAEVLGWDDRMRYIYSKRLMTGTAKLFLRTFSAKTWQELRDALIHEFRKRVSRADIHNELRRRKKKANESWMQYMFSMKEIASLSDIDEADVMRYIVDGVPDSDVNKMLLYGADNMEELKAAFRKYEKIKLKSAAESTGATAKTRLVENKQSKSGGFKLKCYNCNEYGHTSKACQKPKRDRDACFKCGQKGHISRNCTVSGPEVMTIQPHREDKPRNSQLSPLAGNDFEFLLKYNFGRSDDAVICSCVLWTLVDSGSPISFIQQRYLPPSVVSSVNKDKYSFVGINNSPLEVIGMTDCNVNFRESVASLHLFVVKDFSMKYSVVLGRDFLKINDYKLTKVSPENKKIITGCESTENQLLNESNLESVTTDFEKQILNIDFYNENEKSNKSLMHFDINDKVPYKLRAKVEEMILRTINRPCEKVKNSEIVLHIKLLKDEPFCCTPRRLPHQHKIELQKILDDLLKRGVIRESCSPFASPIVLVKKKNNEFRLCVDYRALNKVTVKDNYPLPLIEDLIDGLQGKNWFTTLDLKSGFHHVKVAEDSIRYTSFVTPLGQFEYLKMPFGLKNAPSVFQRYINHIFRPLISTHKLMIYMDDLLIASETIEEHLNILEEVFALISDYGLELRYDKCRFFCEEIVYLGYVVSNKGIRPNPENLKAISDFPIPTSTKAVHSFIGLCSYFRKFIENFALVAKPLYDLLKKDVPFRFGEVEFRCFDNLKAKLLEAPILAIYNPNKETELHCDASSIGFGAILLQRQADNRFHPVFYFSKRATIVESRYHSYELETLSIIYALRRFRIYLMGMKFKIVTDCQSLALTLKKKIINPRISRWALELQDYDYFIEHRPAGRMNHVDALSRCVNIMLIEEDSFEFALAAAQKRDPIISRIALDLEKAESPMYDLVNGLVYRKCAGDLRFYVPPRMEEEEIRSYHEYLCHSGLEKCYEYLKRAYWFPDMRTKIKAFMDNCLKCLFYSSVSGKPEGSLHPIPKASVPFDTLHIDHYGPLPAGGGKKYILVVIDSFTRFTKLYAVGGTTTNEVTRCLESYFNSYSRPKRIISDRGSCFTSSDFSKFLQDNCIEHVKVATMTPAANGQVERINRILKPMLSKECGLETTRTWREFLPKVEFALNNTFNRSTGCAPSKLLFGINQRGGVCDRIMEHLKNGEEDETCNLEEVRDKASKLSQQSQNYNKRYYDGKHKKPREYQCEDYVLLKSVDNTPGVNKKFLPKYRGPYKIIKILGNDRYLVRDIDGMQVSRIPYEGVCSASNMKPYIKVDDGQLQCSQITGDN